MGEDLHYPVYPTRRNCGRALYLRGIILRVMQELSINQIPGSGPIFMTLLNPCMLCTKALVSRVALAGLGLKIYGLMLHTLCNSKRIWELSYSSGLTASEVGLMAKSVSGELRRENGSFIVNKELLWGSTIPESSTSRLKIAGRFMARSICSNRTIEAWGLGLKAQG